MVDEGKNCLFEGALVWSKTDDHDAIWKISKILDVGNLNEMNSKYDIQVELEDGERITIKTKLEENKIDEYQNIKPRTYIDIHQLKNYDLSTLSIINEPEILERIRLCHTKNIRYLSVGPILIFLHRFETIPSVFNPTIYKQFFLVDDIRHDILNSLTPHMAQLVYQIHLKVSHTLHTTSFRSTQAIIMLGESGSGKSKCAKDICSHLAYLASTTVRKNTQTTYIPDVKLFDSIHCILDSFGHAQTTRNPHSSRYSKAIKVSYDDDTGLIKGIIYRCFHLESYRVVQQLSGESNYRVFYDVFDDIYFAAQAMSKYGIDNLTMFRYTTKRPNSTFQPGKSSYKDLSAALEFVANLPKAKQNTSIFGLLAAILHLGELEFDEIDNYGDISTVLSTDPVSIDRQNRVLNLLGISIDSLYSAITKKNLNFAGNIVEKNLDLNDSILARDALACQLYSALFRWIVSKTNEGIASKFPSTSRVSNLFKTSTTPTSTTTANDDETSNIPQNTFFLYDLTGFENIERNSLEQLCINYSNERIYQFLNQIIFLLNKELFVSENILNLNILSIPSNIDNSLTIRLLDNRSNGIFTICDDQLKLKSSTSDEKLANILYVQHGNNKNFIFSKLEQKNCEFFIKHYVTQVKYNVLGFTSSNKLEPTTEILDCLKSSSLSFIKEELFSFCDFKTLSNVSSQSGLSPALDLSTFKQTSSRNLLDRSPSGRNFFDQKSPSSRNLLDRSPSNRNFFDQKSPSSRNLNARNSFDSSEPRRENFLKQRSFAHSHSDISGSAPGRGLMRAPSAAVRGTPGTPPTPRNTAKVATLTSSCSTMMTEIISEAKLADVTFFMCLKLNDCNDPLKFDQLTVLRQIKPYGISDILSFYQQTYPYRMDHVSFINRFCMLSLIYSKDKHQSRDFMIAVWECRSRGMENLHDWRQLCHELIPMIPSIPEFDNLSEPITATRMSDDEQIAAVRRGIKVGELNVYMTALSFTYLNAFQMYAIELIKQKIYNFYKNTKTKTRQKAGVKIGSLMLRLLDRTRTAKESKRNASIIAIQARVRCFLVRRRLQKAKEVQESQTSDVPDLSFEIHQELENEIPLLEQELSPRNDDSEELMISLDFDDVSHNQLTNDIILEKVDLDSLDLNRNEGNVNLEDLSSKDPESVITNTLLPTNRINSVSNDDNEEEEVAQITNVDTLEFDDDVSLEPINVAKSISPSASQNLLHHFNAAGNSPKLNSTPSFNSGLQTPNPPPLSLAQQTKINELQAKVDSLEVENSRLRRKLESLSSFVREEEKTPEPPSPAVSSTLNRKNLASRMSSVGSYVDGSVYGGEFSRMDHFASNLDLRPDYEKYVQKTLETLDEDITYLLHGAPFYKFGRSGSVHKTIIHLSTDFRFLYWKPKNSLVKSADDCRVDLRLVWRLVPGQSTPPFQAYKGISHGPMPPKRSFSLIYGFRSLDLCALDDETYDNWFVGLKYVLQLINGELQEAGLDRQLLRKKWNYIDRNNLGFLSRREIIQLVSVLGIQFDRSSFTTALLKSTIGNSTHDEITFSQFDSLVYQLRRRPDLEILWSKVISGYDFSKDITPLQIDNGSFDASLLQEVIGVNTFKEFWKLSQNRLLSDDEAKKMIAEGMGEMHQEDFPVLSYNGFVSIMTHYKNDAYDPVSCVHSSKSMTYPLQHYYISCSDGAAIDIPNQEYYHSISLEDKKPNSYVIALQNGCRALELRCFEEPINPQGEQTDLFVGNPRNKERVTFKETMLHIHRVAFTISNFPLILLMEIGCSVPQQKRAAKLLTKLFGNAIFTPAETQTKLLPSPLDLKNRVIIFLIHRKRDIHTAYRVGKEIERMNTAASFVSMKSSQSFDSTTDKKFRSPNLIQQLNESFDDVEEIEDDYDSESEYGLDPPITSVSPKNRSHSRVPRNGYLVLDQEAIGKDGTLDKSQMELIQKCDVIHSSLMRLCHYSRGLRIGSHPLRDMLARLADDPQAEESLINFNMKRFTYIYMDQNTKRFGSYGGMVNAWDCGISMVSLCHDYPSLGTKINSGRFRQNGNCGYVLKPECYRNPSTPTPDTPPLMLTLHIISGKDLPIPKLPPDEQESSITNSPATAPKKSYSRMYSNEQQDTKSADTRIIRTSTYDLNSTNLQEKSTTRGRNKGFSVAIDLNGATCDDIQNKTRSIKRHGRSPYWNEIFTFSVKDTSQGQLTLRIFYNDYCSCYVSIPLRNLRSGYRSVALYEEIEENNFISSRLNLGSLFIRVRFDEIAQYNNLSSLPENIKKLEESKKSNLQRFGSNIMTPSTPLTDIQSQNKINDTNTTTSSSKKRTSSKDYRRSQSEGRTSSRDKSGSGGNATTDRIPRRTQSRSSTRGIISYDSTPIIYEGTNERESTVPRISVLDGGESGPSRVRSRRDTKTRRKSETNYEISEELTNHYKAEEIESSFNYQEVIEAEKEQNARKLSLRRLSQIERPENSQNVISQPPPPPPPPPRLSQLSGPPPRLSQLSGPPPRLSQLSNPTPPPPPPLSQLSNPTGISSSTEEKNEDEHLPSYNSAVNLIELREQNIRNIRKFEVDSGDEATPNRPSEDGIDPWTPPV